NPTKMKFLILAGGRGTRLWPVSRKNNPKQFQKLTSDKTMLQETVGRILPVAKMDDIYISTNKEYRTEIKKELPEIPQKNIICEPANRERTAAFALAIAHFKNGSKNPPNPLLQRGKRIDGETMVVMPSDHFIKKSERLLKAIIKADKFLEEHPDYLVAFGIKPTDPETGYGYVKSSGKTIKKINSCQFLKVDKFVEKPNLKTARRYIENGNYFWNSGIYVWKTDTILERIKEFIPDIYSRYLKINKAFGTKSFDKVLAKEYPQMDKVSPEYTILENYKKIAVIPLDLGWSDVGSWSALKDVLVKPNKHYTKGEHLDLGSKNLLVYGSKKLVITVGLKDLVIVDTDDVILICDKNETQKIKEVVGKLEKGGKVKLL
ncbi:MAG: sugar phosphate nucleotidyltransferase, partial [Patescibacteria group bacterium]|nr:sugar phosphate nucleotidyltransferase [Patescibacteria group bacterium]